jgi:hypothetical protein
VNQQQSLQSPLGIIMTGGMVAIAVVLVGALALFLLGF